MGATPPFAELKKGSAELFILALLEDRERHGYEIARLIDERSGGALRFHAASLYPILYRLEDRGWIRGKWLAVDGRRRRHYRLMPAGRRVLADQRSNWRTFFAVVDRVAGIRASEGS